MTKGKKNFSKGKVIFSLFLISAGFVLLFGKPEKAEKTFETAVKYSTAQEPIKAEGFDGETEKTSAIPKKIIIPSLSLSVNIKKAGIIEGYWEVYESSASWGEGSGLPGYAGNQVIFAHAREGLFLPLKDIKEKEVIYVLTESNWFEYSVEKIKEVKPDDLEVIKPTKDEILTIYTCSGFNDNKRLIIVAKRIN